MGELLRRREMMQEAGGGPEWDVEWDYTMGLPNANGLFSLTTNGTASASLTSSSVDLSVQTNGSWIAYDYTTFYPKAVIEVKIRTTGSNNTFWRLSLSADGAKGAAVRGQISSGVNGIYYVNNTNISSCTRLMETAYSTDYIVRIVMDAGYADVYVNGTLVASHVDISSTAMYSTLTRFSFQCVGSGIAKVMRLYYIKMKLGRIS